MSDQYKSEPLARQREEIEQTWHLPAWGHNWDMGTGKSKLALDTAARLYREGKVTALVVLAPNGVQRQWAEEQIPEHLPDDVAKTARVLVYQSSKGRTQWQRRAVRNLVEHPRLAVLIMTYNSVMTDHGRDALWKLLRARPCLYVLDESHMIKTPGAKRTKRVVASGRYAPYRRLLTGTMATESPFDVYSQVKFLDERFWRRKSIGSAQVFRHRFGVFTDPRDPDREVDYVTGYKDLEVLQSWMSEITSRVLKEEMVDLPPKTFQRVYFDLTPQQRRAYQELKDEYETELDSGQLVTAPLVITRLLRFAQITSGYIPSDDGVLHRFPTNPRLGPVEEFRDSITRPSIVWAERDEDIDQLLALLGEHAVRYDGKCTDAQRERAKAAFQAGDRQFFVSKPSVGGTGLNLTIAKYMMFYNVGPSLRLRLQAEDRFHRIGQEDAVTIVDVLASGTIDERVLQRLREKFDISAQVTGEMLREWL